MEGKKRYNFTSITYRHRVVPPGKGPSQHCTLRWQGCRQGRTRWVSPGCWYWRPCFWITILLTGLEHKSLYFYLSPSLSSVCLSLSHSHTHTNTHTHTHTCTFQMVHEKLNCNWPWATLVSVFLQCQRKSQMAKNAFLCLCLTNTYFWGCSDYHMALDKLERGLLLYPRCPQPLEHIFTPFVFADLCCCPIQSARFLDQASPDLNSAVFNWIKMQRFQEGSRCAILRMMMVFKSLFLLDDLECCAMKPTEYFLEDLRVSRLLKLCRPGAVFRAGRQSLIEELRVG